MVQFCNVSWIFPGSGASFVKLCSESTLDVCRCIQTRKLTYAQKIFWFIKPCVRLPVHNNTSQMNLEMRVRGSASYLALNTPIFNHKWSIQRASWMLMHKKNEPADGRLFMANHSNNWEKNVDTEITMLEGEVAVRTHVLLILLWRTVGVHAGLRRSVTTVFICFQQLDPDKIIVTISGVPHEILFQNAIWPMNKIYIFMNFFLYSLWW